MCNIAVAGKLPSTSAKCLSWARCMASCAVAALATLRHRLGCQSECAHPTLQIFKIDDHMGIAISGLTADGRILCRYMRNECLNHR